MALIKIDLFSEKLLRTVTINAIVPIDKSTLSTTSKKENRPFKTLYLLHGIFGNYSDWICNTRIQQWAQDKNLVVIMPSGENGFYIDNDKGLNYYGQFIGQELVEKTRQLFPLSNKKEDTFIGGLSMGGYGALVNGLKYHETFSHICALSPALILEDAMHSSKDSHIPIFSRDYYESVFGDLDNVISTDKDYNHLIVSAKKLKVSLPKIWISCGLQDRLLTNNRKYIAFLKENGIDYEYIEEDGGHDWDFWDRHIKKVLEWLPLDVTTKSVHSGNITLT